MARRSCERPRPRSHPAGKHSRKLGQRRHVTSSKAADPRNADSGWESIQRPELDRRGSGMITVPGVIRALSDLHPGNDFWNQEVEVRVALTVRNGKPC